ncbi:MAG: tetratricopeptide repeat protein, partial [Saprospiraceae bacterium]|nr:tetratricopeptide repeat protein [Saprospiraceae bacterium]
KDLQNIKNITAQAATTQAAITRILRTEEWDFAAVYFIALDHYCHGFMKYHPPRRAHIEQYKFDLFKNVVQGGYRYLDMMLGRLLELAGEDTVVMLVSDHGFQPDALRPKEIPQEPAGLAYEHSYYGVICAKGPGIKKDGLVYGASLLDITPTLLTAMGLPVGSDMDGKVLSGIFELPPEPTYIPSWEAVAGASGMPPADYVLPASTTEEMVEQLADLGYVDNQGPDAAKNNRAMAEFCKFNLARAYLDGNKLPEATQVYEELHREHPEAPWYMVRLATCYQMAGRLRDCRDLVDLLKTKDFYDPAVVHVLEGSLLLGERRYREALKALKAAEKQVDPAQSRIWLQIAQCYLMLGKNREAEQACKKHLALDHDTPFAHQLLG